MSSQPTENRTIWLLGAALGLYLMGCNSSQTPTEGNETYLPSAAVEASLTFGPFPGGTTIFVDVDNNTGVEDGSRAHPFRTLSKAIKAAKSGSVVGLAPGVYAETFGPESGLNYVIDGLRNFKLLGSGVTRTTIRGDHSGSLILVQNGASGLIRGFTIEQGGRFLNSEGGGIQVVGRPAAVSLTVERVRLQDNLAVNGGAIAAEGEVALRLINVLMANNQASNCCGGTILREGVNAKLTNTTITNNSANFSAGGVVVEDGAALNLMNSIIWKNSLNELVQIGSGSSLTVSFSDVGEKLFRGVGNLSSDPKFAAPTNRDYRLHWNSPAVDAGTNTGAPTTDLTGRTRPLDGDGDGVAETDMGALERIAAP